MLAEDGLKQGNLLVAYDQDMLDNKAANCNLLHWRSGKLARLVNSTLAAETQSLARGVGDLLWLIVMYAEVTEPEFQLRNWRRHVQRQGYTAFSKQNVEEITDAIAVVDAKSLFDILSNETNGGSDKRTALDVQVLREELKDLQGKIRWVDHLHMPADCLTKKDGRSEMLKQLLTTGRFAITAEAATMTERSEVRRKRGYNRR